MPSAKEMRCWLILGLGLLWGLFIGVLLDELGWARGGSLEATLHQLHRTTALNGWIGMGILGCTALMVTRFAYSVLRTLRQDEWPQGGR